MTFYYSIGLMSGTSMDGVDVALIRTDGEDIVEFLSATSVDYEPSFILKLKEVENIIASHHGVFDEKDMLLSFDCTIKDVINESADYHILAINNLLKKSKILPQTFLIGYHGQTFYHNAETKKSVILGNPERISNHFNQRIIFNFRENDLKNGGKGAPLAPLYHYILCKRDHLIPTAVVNCGGISNVTFIPSDQMEDVIAFDVGPGNTLLDRFIRFKTHNQYQMDKDGMFSKNETYDPKYLDLLMHHSVKNPYFYEKKPPKALDVNDFVLPEDVLKLPVGEGAKLLCDFTALMISKSRELINIEPSLWIVAGGGFSNPTIFESLKAFLPKNQTIKLADEVGWRSKSLEAELFAYLAVRSYLKKAISFPHTTGVTEPLSGGDCYFK
jgi:anhydro-N-acetylmuramic acid kinase